jgi:hypothetical protein
LSFSASLIKTPLTFRSPYFLESGKAGLVSPGTLKFTSR